MKTLLQRAHNFISRFICISKIVIARIIVSVLSFFTKKKDNWLVLERGFDAQDNAWHFFKYLITQHPEINVIYAINTDSSDYNNNLRRYHNYCVEYNTLKYFIFLYCSQVIISTHVQTYIPRFDVYCKIKGGKLDVPGKKVFLQHGIIHNDMSCFKYPDFKIDLFISGAYNEYQLLKRNLNQPEGVLSYTGLARFDNLFNFKTKRQILVMPTWWRIYCGYSNEQFVGTDFFQAYISVLSDKRIKAKLIEKDYQILYYNHFEFQKFNELFEPYCSERVHLVKFGDLSVQDLLKQSAVLVTDYSSIYYDYLYMGKPIIFFHLNEDKFRQHQYGKEYDDVSEFGVVVNETNQLIEVILKCIDDNCVMGTEYTNKMNDIFRFRDCDNCKRIFTEITNIIQIND